MITLGLDAMKIQKLCLRGEDTQFPNIGVLGRRLSILRDRLGSSSSVIPMVILEKEVPGPGAYHDINALSDRGHYPLSRTTGYGKRYFDKEHRVGKF